MNSLLQAPATVLACQDDRHCLRPPRALDQHRYRGTGQDFVGFASQQEFFRPARPPASLASLIAALF